MHIYCFLNVQHILFSAHFVQQVVQTLALWGRQMEEAWVSLALWFSLELSRQTCVRELIPRRKECGLLPWLTASA